MIEYLWNWLKSSFTNLSFKGFVWPREPVLYMALAVAILNAVIAVINGSLGLSEAIDAIIIAIGAFAARGKVSPTPQP
jgi:hypothetical protein